MAGEAARDLAHRHRHRADRLVRAADASEHGALGERSTSAVLDALRDEGFTAFHDVRWPGGQRTNVDHVVVGPPGVFVIDTKSWSGPVEVRDNTVWCHGRRQDTMVAAAGDAALAVVGLLSPPAAGTVRSALCFVRDEPVAGRCYEVMLCSTATLREMLLSRPVVLTPEQVQLASAELDLGFRAAGVTTAVPPVPQPQSVVDPPVRPTVRRVATTSVIRRDAIGAGLLRLVVLLVLSLLLISQLPRLAGIAEFVHGGVAAALASSTPAPYERCAALRTDFPNGVGTAAAVEDLRRKRQRPDLEPLVYAVNVALDKDHDGLACERER
jgi:hypothetical protein